MPELPAGVTTADAIGALHAVENLWTALAADDDEAIRDLVVEALVARDDGNGLARRVRETFGVTIGQCAAMGTSPRARVLPSGSLAFWSTPVWHRTVIDAPTLVAGWGWELAQAQDGHWQVVAPTDSTALETAPQVHLPDEALSRGPLSR